MTYVRLSPISQIQLEISITHAHTHPFVQFFLARILPINFCFQVTVYSGTVHPRVFALMCLNICLRNLGILATTLPRYCALAFSIVSHTYWWCVAFSPTEIFNVIVKLSFLTLSRYITTLPIINLSPLGGYDGLLSFVQARFISFDNYDI